MKPPAVAVVVALLTLAVALPLVPAGRDPPPAEITTPVSGLEESSTTFQPIGPPLRRNGDAKDR